MWRTRDDLDSEIWGPQPSRWEAFRVCVWCSYRHKVLWLRCRRGHDPIVRTYDDRPGSYIGCKRCGSWQHPQRGWIDLGFWWKGWVI